MAAVTIAAVVLALVTPWLIARTALRDTLINAILGTPDLTASTERASFGWFSPLSLEGVEINGKAGRFRIDLESITTEHSWPKLLASSPHLGTISIQEPHVQMLLPLGELCTQS